MAAPSRTVPHPGRALVLLLVLIVAMLLGVLGGKLFSPSEWRHQFKVGLGLDLSSGTQVTLQAQTLSGKAPPADEMNAAVSVIEARVNGTGNSGAQVQPQGTNLLVVTVPGQGSSQTIQLVSSTALLMFRQVLLYQPYRGAVYGDVRLVNQNTLALFRKLACTPDNTSTWKDQVGYTTADDYGNPGTQIVSCDASGNKYALDVATVAGAQISDATAELSTTSNQWEVTLRFNSAGASAFGTLTLHQYNTYYRAAQAGNQDDYWLDTIAVVLDGNVITAPQTAGPIPGGVAQITGNFTRAQADELAADLQSGALPADLRVSAVSALAPSASSRAAAG